MLIIFVCTSLLQNIGIDVQITNGHPTEPAITSTAPNGTPLTSELASLAVASAEDARVIPASVSVTSSDIDTAHWKQILWAVGERNVLYQTDTPNSPGTFRHENSLGGDFAHRDGAIIELAIDADGTLWVIGPNQWLYYFDDTHPDNVVKVGSIRGTQGLRSLAMTFDNRNRLWVAQYGDKYNPWRLYEVELSLDAERKLTLSDRGRFSSDIQTVSAMTFHEGSLFIADAELDSLFEIADPRSPDTVVDRGPFPDDLGSADEIASDVVSIWIVDEQRGANEFWRLDDTNDPSSAVEVGDIRDMDGGTLHSRVNGLAFQRVRVTEESQENVAPTVGDMWLASSDTLYKLPEGAELSELKEIGALEGAFVNTLDIQSISFDSKGRLYILGVRDGVGGHKLYGLDNMANPRDAFIVSHLEGVADWAGQTRPSEIVVDAQDRIWIYDNDYTDVYLLGEDGTTEVWECPEELGPCIVPETFASGYGYAAYPSGIFSLLDFTNPYSYVETGQLPEEGKGVRNLTAGIQAFWGLAQEGIEQHLWRLPNIEAPGEAVKFGEFSERSPVFVDMAIYRTEK